VTDCGSNIGTTMNRLRHACCSRAFLAVSAALLIRSSAALAEEIAPSPTAAAPTEARAPGQCGPYVLTYFNAGSLYYRTAQGEYVGIDRDVVEELIRRSGCIIHTRLESRAHTWTNLANGTLDITVSGLPTPERAQFAHFIPYYVTRNYVIMRKGEAVPSLRAFVKHRTLRLAIVKSYNYGPQLEAWIAELRALNRVDEYPDLEVATRVVGVGRADATISQPLVWQPTLEALGLVGKVTALDWSTEPLSGALVLSKARVRTEDLVLLRRTLNAMRADGTLRRIFARHLPADLARKVVH
jgi:polar amino acid transport system substrate-binding protein